MSHSNDPSGLKRSLAAARDEIKRLTAELEQMTAIKDIHQEKRHEYFERSKKAEAERDEARAQVASIWKGPGETPHRYSPDYMAQGDCQVCGHTREAHQSRP